MARETEAERLAEPAAPDRDGEVETPLLLTVLTPTLNCAKTLADTLRSIEAIANRFPGRIQHLIGDAGSTDGTREQLAAHCERNAWARLREIRGANIPATLNALLAETVGRWIIVLNGDDYFDAEGLGSLLERAAAFGPNTILCGDVEILTIDGRHAGFRYCRLDRLHRHMAVNHPAMLVSRTVFRQISLFDVNCPKNYDGVWVWQAYRGGAKYVYCPGIVAHCRQGGVSSQFSREAAWELLRYKVAAGYALPAIFAFGSHCLKTTVRSILPEPIARKLTRHYRRLTGSIDHY